MAYQSEIEKLEARFREKPEQWFAALADAYRKSGDVDMALEVLGAWIDRRPSYTSGHIVRGRCLLDRERLPEAADAFEQVLRLDMENVIALKSLAEIAERSGDAPAARRWLKRLLDVDPMNEEARDALDRLGGDEPQQPPPAPSEAPAAMPAFGLSIVDLDHDESSELTIERTSEALEIPTVPAGAGEAVELGWPEPVEGLERTIHEAAEQGGEPVAGKEPEPAITAEELEDEPAALEAAGEPGPSGVPMAPGGSEAPVGIRAETPGPSLDLASPASEWEMPEPPPPAPAGEPAVSPPAPDAAEPAVTDVESMAPERLEQPEPLSADGFVSAGFDAAFEEFAAQAGPLETAALPEMDDDLPMNGAPASPAPPRADLSSSADGVAFVQPSPNEVERDAIEAPFSRPEVADREELPLILPEEVSADLDEPSIREPEPVVTETMAALYASQGLYAEARDTYRKLLARDPGNPRLKALLDEVGEMAAGAKLESAGRRDRYAAAARGRLSVGQLMRQLAEAAPGAAAPPDAGVDAVHAGGEPPSPSMSAFSFDEFFAEDASTQDTGADESVSAEPGKPEDDEFRGWLEGLKT